MTMTRDEAVRALAGLWQSGLNGDALLSTPEYEALEFAIAALSAQEQEPWGWEWVDGSDTGVVTLRQDYEKYKRDYPRMTFTALYAAPPAQAVTAKPVRVTREALHRAHTVALYGNSMAGDRNPADLMLAALQSLGINVEVDGG